MVSSTHPGPAETSVGRFALRQSRLDFADGDLVTDCDSDLLICMRSWEDRSLHAFERFGAACGRVILFEFDPSFGKRSTSTRFEELQRDMLQRKALNNVKLGRSTDYFANMEIIRQALDYELSRRKRVRKIWIDISALSKAYSSSLLGYLFGRCGAIWVRCVYSEAEYGAAIAPSAVSAEIQGATFELSNLGRFTDGNWQLKTLAHLPTYSDPRESRRIVAFCGGDEDRLILALQQYEMHERFVIVAASNSAASQDNARQRIESLVRYAPLEADKISQCHPHSAVEMITTLSELRPPRPSDSSMLIMPFSTKPHAIAAAIFCLAHDRVAMVARIPAAYVPRTANRTSRVWLYDTFDLTSPYIGSLL